ncbi:MAG: molybdenum cofactor biosynthesis enzyme MoaA [Saprospiraceae bacterium]|jgi:molybdenum cofactor biosynthesis enzyme MoaA
MPAEGIQFSEREDLLTYEEIVRLAHVFKSLGVKKVRLTGGEPFVRKDIDQLLRSLSEIFSAVHITTNATRLDVPLLKEIGISGLNISLDSLDRDKFFMITRRDESEKVMANIHECINQELPIKINMVVMKGVNDMEILDFVDFGIKYGVEVRFIEAMPFNEGDGNRDVFMSAIEMLALIQTRYPEAVQYDDLKPSSAIHYKIGDSKFDIIPAYSRSLCGTCNRIRLTPKGELLNCLYSQKGTELRDMLRDSNVSDTQLSEVIQQSVFHKLKNGFEAESEMTGDVFRSMTTIGG